MTAFQISEAFGGLPEDFVARELKFAAKSLSDSDLPVDMPDDPYTDKAKSRPVWLQTVLTAAAAAACLLLIAGSVYMIAALSKKPDPADPDLNPKPVVSETTADKTGTDRQTQTTVCESTHSASADTADITNSTETAAVTAETASETETTCSKSTADTSASQKEIRTTAAIVSNSETTASSAAENIFDEQSFFVYVGTYGQNIPQFRYLYPRPDGTYTADKVLWKKAPRDLVYGDVFVAEGDVPMTQVYPAADDPANAHVYFYTLGNGADLKKAGNCSEIMESKDLNVISLTYDGSAHWSVRYVDGAGKTYYYGLSTFGSDLLVDPLDCEVGDVYTYALYQDCMVIPLVKRTADFDELMSMSPEEFAALPDLNGYLTWIEDLKQKYEVEQGIAEYDLLMRTEAAAAEMYSSPKAAQVLGIPEKMLEIEEPDGEYYNADGVNVTGRMVVLNLNLCAYGNDPERKARAYYLSEKQLKNCEAIAEFTPWRYGA